MKTVKILGLIVGAFIFGVLITSGFWIVPIAVGTCTLFPLTSGCDNNPPWGPFLDNPHAKFYISKLEDNYVLNYEYRNNKGYYMIQNSQIDLDPYLNKKVLVPGHFVTIQEPPISEQCIQNKCHKTMRGNDVIYSKYIVDINNLELK